MWEGRAALSEALLSGPNIFTTTKELDEIKQDPDWNGLITSPRNLTLLVGRCDGTKEDLLNR